MTGHTPGPWMLHDMEHAIVVTVDKNPSICIADCNPTSSPYDVNQANARLIAAAPETAAERDRLREINAELFDALVKFRAALAMGPLDIAASYGPDAYPDIALEDAARVADAAIAKATGDAA